MASGKFSALYEADEAPAPAAKPAPVDAGPEARRAAAGRPPGPREMVDEGTGPEFVSVRTLGGESQRGRLPQAPPVMDPTQASGVPDPAKFRSGPPRAPTELESDPGLQMITAAALGMGAGGGAGVAVRGLGGDIVGTGVAPAASAATEGAVSSKAMGGDASTGIAFGGLARLGSALKGVGQAYRNVGARREVGIMRDLGTHGTDAQKTELTRLGAQKVAEMSKRYGVVGAPDAQAAAEGVRNGVRAVGSDIGATYDTLGTQYARPLGDLMVTMNQVQQKLRGTRSGNAVADAIHDEMKTLFDAHGGNAQATIPLGTLRKELTDSQEIGFAGAKFGALPDTMKAVVQREVADGLRHELDKGLAVAAKDPRYASMIERLDTLNGDYHALKVLEGVTNRMAAKAPFRGDPKLAERMPFKNPPASRTPIMPPTGRTLGRLPASASQAAAPEPLAAGMASALARGDRDAAAVDMANELFGRPVRGLSPVAPVGVPLEPGIGALRTAQ